MLASCRLSMLDSLTMTCWVLQEQETIGIVVKGGNLKMHVLVDHGARAADSFGEVWFRHGLPSLLQVRLLRRRTQVLFFTHWSDRLEMCQLLRENWTRRAYGARHAVPARAGSESSAADRSRCGERQVNVAGIEGSRERRADLLPVTEEVRRSAGRPGKAVEGTGAGEREAEASGCKR
jgi:hypothetical protein